MTKQYSEKEVEAALSQYRQYNENILIVFRENLPLWMSKIATVSDKFAFVTSFKRQKKGLVTAGQMNEDFYMCDEFFSYAKGEKPKDKPLYELSIDMILGIEEDPFMMVSCSPKTSEYVQRICNLERKVENGVVLKSNNTSFIQYDEKDVLKGINFKSLEFLEEGGYRITVNKKNPPQRKIK